MHSVIKNLFLEIYTYIYLLTCQKLAQATNVLRREQRKSLDKSIK